MTCDRAASRILKNVEFFIRNGELADAQYELRRVIRMVEQMESERGVSCECAELEAVSPTRETGS